MYSRGISSLALGIAAIVTPSCSRSDAPPASPAQCNIPATLWSQDASVISNNDMMKIKVYLREGELDYLDRYRAGGSDWAESLRRTATLSPKPAVLLHIDARSTCADIERVTRAIATRYDCDPLHCFFVPG